MESTLEELVKSLVPDLSFDELKWASKWVRGPLSVSSTDKVPLGIVTGKLLSQQKGQLIELETLLRKLERKCPDNSLASGILQVILKSAAATGRPEMDGDIGVIVASELVPAVESPVLSMMDVNGITAAYEEAAFGHGISEQMLVQDIVYILQGIDGKYIKLNGDVSVNTKLFIRQTVSGLIELGLTYKQIVESLSNRTIPSLLFLTFKSSLVKHLREYLAIAALIDTNASQWTLLKISAWISIPGRKLKFLQAIVERVCKEPVRVLQTLFDIKRESFMFKSIVDSLFNQTVSVWLELASQWASRGKLPASSKDFFVRRVVQSDMRPAKLSSDKIDMEALWNETFEVPDVPQFLDGKTVSLILASGKSAAFLRACGHALPWVDETRFKRIDELPHDAAVVCEGLSKQVIEMVMNQYRLVDRLIEIQRFMLLSQGDFAECLSVVSRKELVNGANGLNKYELQFMIDSALRRSVISENDLDSALSRVSVFLNMPGNSSDTGYEVFSVDLCVDPALQLILTKDKMHQYRKFFSFLWRLLRSEQSLRDVWRDLQTVGRRVNSAMILDGVEDLIEKANVVRSEISWFLYVFRSLVCYEIVESQWRQFFDQVKAATDLDHLIKAHDDFVHTLEDQLFMSPDDETVLCQIEAILNVAIRFANAFPSINAELSSAIATRDDVSDFRFSNISALLDDFHDLYNSAYNTLMDLLEQKTSSEFYQQTAQRLKWHSA